jgi:hypothetical protein
MPDQQGAVRPAAGHRNIAEIWWWPDASQVAATSFSAVMQSIFGKRVQLTGSYVLFHLVIPRFRVESGKPLSKHGQLVGREFANRLLDFLHGAHGSELYPVDAIPVTIGLMITGISSSPSHDLADSSSAI